MASAEQLKSFREELDALRSEYAAKVGERDAEHTCQPEYRVGTTVWYAVETQPREARYFDSGCTKAAGARATVVFFERHAREVIFCDLELALPDALRARLDAVQ